MLSRLRAWGDQLRSSLFFIPMLWLIAGIVLGEAMLVVDALVSGIDPRLTATADSAKTVLTTVAGATLSFAGIAFSVSLPLISLALGIASILAIVAFINHAAHSMDVSNILRRVTEEVLAQADTAWSEPDPEPPPRAAQGESPRLPEEARAVRFSPAGCRTWPTTRSREPSCRGAGRQQRSPERIGATRLP